MIVSESQRVDKDGSAFIPLQLKYGSFLLFLDELLEPAKGDVHATSCWTISLLQKNVSVMRTCYNFPEDLVGDTRGAVPRRIDSSGILIESGNPDTFVRVTVWGTETAKELQSLQNQLDATKESNEKLIEEVSAMKEMLEQVYYAPGMPGYQEAMESFDEVSRSFDSQRECSF